MLLECSDAKAWLESESQEIGVIAVRGGDIVGEHTVMFVTGGERIELIHRAHSRDALAKRRHRGCPVVGTRPVGLYDMQDMLGLKVTDETGRFVENGNVHTEC